MQLEVATKASVSLSARLSRGVLEVDIKQSAVAPEALFGFAERHNPKRAFLFVSRVLGKHIPVRPRAMQSTYESLAARIPKDLPGPVVVIGMAETAVGLGAGVHRCYAKHRPDSMYMVTTRHQVGSDLLARFEEEHSHASTHFVHQPAAVELRAMLRSARSLVLVDDEASTGRTLNNLHRALIAAELTFERVVSCVLTDWSTGAVCEGLPGEKDRVSLLRGSYTFTANDSTAALPKPGIHHREQPAWPLDPARDWGRLGVREVADTLLPDFNITPGEKVLVLGTGEFVWQPFLLAERLERAGADVHFSSTTRSPIAVGHCIEHVLGFPDNYGQGIDNFLYNVKPGQFDRVLLCSETAGEAMPMGLIDALQAEVVVEQR